MLNLLKKTPSSPAPIFVTSNFDLKDLKSIIETNIPLLNDTFYKCNITSNKLILDYNIKEDKETISSNRLQFVKNDNIIYVTEEQSTVVLTTYKETSSPSKSDIKSNSIFTAIQEHILNLQDDGLYALHNSDTLAYIQSPDTFTKNYIFHQLLSEEYALSVLNISSITFKDTTEHSKDTIWHFVLTSSRVLLISNSNTVMQTIDISNDNLLLHEKRGKDLIESKAFSFYTEFMNDVQYAAIFPAVLTEGHRLSIFADCILKDSNAKTKVLDLASKCYAITFNTTSNTIDDLKSGIITHLKGFQIKKEQSEVLLSTLKPFSTKASFGNDLIQTCINWGINYKEQHNLFKLLLELKDKIAIQNSIVFYDYFKPLFLKEETKEDAIFEFNLTYGKLLATAERYEDAIYTYKGIYDTLPDDSIADLLPADTTNILQGEGGQQLKITLLESILNWQQKQQVSTLDTDLKLAQLQPLLNHRLEALHANNTIKQKAVTIEQALHFKDLKYHDLDYVKANYNRLIKNEILKDVVPECFKYATGFFDSLNGYIASIQSPNYDAVTSFSDKLTATNYPNAYKTITNMCYALSIDTPECYIGRANYSDAIIGIEGKPPYLIIGIDFIETESYKQLNTNELKFLVAIELAHIYFEHTKITSTDVWRGAAEKGFSFLTTVLSIIPFAGSIGNLLGNLSNVDKYAKIIKNVEKATNIAEKGQNILDVTDKLNFNLLGNGTSDENQSQNLLITSRLMEIIADKVALLFCNDLQAAIKGIILSSTTLEKELDAIRDYGLYNVLERKNEDGSFRYQELIIRIRSLCSFYLSDTFEDLKTQLYIS
jgi:hypothetical protein